MLGPVCAGKVILHTVGVLTALNPCSATAEKKNMLKVHVNLWRERWPITTLIQFQNKPSSPFSALFFSIAIMRVERERQHFEMFKLTAEN